MAEQAYGKALALDAGNGPVKAKLDATRELGKRIRETR
jgi:hypothetical protein